MKLFGLKDENGREITLDVDRNYEGRELWKLNRVIFPEEDPLKLKLGDWVRLKREWPLDNKGRIIELQSSMNSCVAIQIPEISYDQAFYERPEDLQLMTPQEIESHLKKICDEKYIGKKVRSLVTCTDYIRKYNFYQHSEDRMWYLGDTYGVLVYEKGKFAEIVSDKKKLPKTKVELEILIKELRVAKSLPLYNEDIDFFLNKYED